MKRSAGATKIAAQHHGVNGVSVCDVLVDSIRHRRKWH
jgi:hypothetical protein